ncbi:MULTISPECIES: heavy-metal-associated domain-containing protein [Falsihalocynthiibacter]
MSKFTVPNMTCGHCTAAIKKAVTAADSAAILTFDLEAHVVEVTSRLDNEALATILKTEGYASSPVS